MAKFLYEKPLLIDLQRNEALFGHGADCQAFGSGAHACMTGGGPTSQGQCKVGDGGGS